MSCNLKWWLGLQRKGRFKPHWRGEIDVHHWLEVAGDTAEFVDDSQAPSLDIWGDRGSIQKNTDLPEKKQVCGGHKGKCSANSIEGLCLGFQKLRDSGDQDSQCATYE